MTARVGTVDAPSSRYPTGQQLDHAQRRQEGTICTMSDPISPMRIQITVRTDTQGRDTASCEWSENTHTVTSSNGAVLALCRSLVADGCPDLPWEVAGRFSGTVHGAAVRTVSDTSFTTWTPHPRAEVSPLLVALVEADRVERAERRAAR